MPFYCSVGDVCPTAKGQPEGHAEAMPEDDPGSYTDLKRMINAF